MKSPPPGGLFILIKSYPGNVINAQAGRLVPAALLAEAFCDSGTTARARRFGGGAARHLVSDGSENMPQANGLKAIGVALAVVTFLTTAMAVFVVANTDGVAQDTAGSGYGLLAASPESRKS
jgi:hypothetical protein